MLSTGCVRTGCVRQVRCRERGLRSAVPLAQFRKLLKFVSGPRFELAVDIPTTDKLLALFAANAPAVRAAAAAALCVAVCVCVIPSTGGDSVWGT